MKQYSIYIIHNTYEVKIYKYEKNNCINLHISLLYTVYAICVGPGRLLQLQFFVQLLQPALPRLPRRPAPLAPGGNLGLQLLRGALSQRLASLLAPELFGLAAAGDFKHLTR